MNLPAREPGHSGRWETIRYAPGSSARTLRLGLIWLVVSAAPVAAAAAAELIRHTLLCEDYAHGPPAFTRTWRGGCTAC
jgi:hypothetical protein